MKYLCGPTLLVSIALLIIYAVQAHSSELQLIATCGPNSLYYEGIGAVADSPEAEVHMETNKFGYGAGPRVRTGYIYVLKFKHLTTRVPFRGGRKKARTTALQSFRFHCNAAGRGGHPVKIKKYGY